MSGYSLDLSYLKEFEGTVVTAIMQLDPRAHNSHIMNEYTGVLMVADKLLIEVVTGKANINELLTTAITGQNIPYLGKSETLWNIRTDEGSTLFDHKRIEKGFYEVLGPNGRVIGKVWLDIPYRTPHGDIQQAIEHFRRATPFSDLYGEDISSFADTAFTRWRDGLIGIQKDLI